MKTPLLWRGLPFLCARQGRTQGAYLGGLVMRSKSLRTYQGGKNEARRLDEIERAKTRRALGCCLRLCQFRASACMRDGVYVYWRIWMLFRRLQIGPAGKSSRRYGVASSR